MVERICLFGHLRLILEKEAGNVIGTDARRSEDAARSFEQAVLRREVLL